MEDKNQIVVVDDLFKKVEDTFYNRVTYVLWRIWYGFFDIPYYLKQRLIRKHHLVKTTLNPWTWHETDDRLLYGMMGLLEDFFDKQLSLDIVNWDGDEEHKHARKEMEEIKNWWKNYPNRLQEIEDALDAWSKEFRGFNKERTTKEKELMDKMDELETKLYKEEIEMMKRLVDVKGFLWT